MQRGKEAKQMFPRLAIILGILVLIPSPFLIPAAIRISYRNYLRKFGKKEEVEKLEELLEASNFYSATKKFLNRMDGIACRSEKLRLLLANKDPESSLNSAQIVEEHYWTILKELKRQKISKWKIRAFM